VCFQPPLDDADRKSLATPTDHDIKRAGEPFRRTFDDESPYEKLVIAIDTNLEHSVGRVKEDKPTIIAMIINELKAMMNVDDPADEEQFVKEASKFLKAAGFTQWRKYCVFLFRYKASVCLLVEVNDWFLEEQHSTAPVESPSRTRTAASIETSSTVPARMQSTELAKASGSTSVTTKNSSVRYRPKLKVTASAPISSDDQSMAPGVVRQQQTTQKPETLLQVPLKTDVPSTEPNDLEPLDVSPTACHSSRSSSQSHRRRPSDTILRPEMRCLNCGGTPQEHQSGGVFVTSPTELSAPTIGGGGTITLDVGPRLGLLKIRVAQVVGQSGDISEIVVDFEGVSRTIPLSTPMISPGTNLAILVVVLFVLFFILGVMIASSNSVF
jgi:hypothetical protein